MFRNVDNSLVANFEFSSFIEAFAFMTEVAEVAESQQHHPEWSNVYNKVSICLTTHDAGNVVTEKDLALARAIEEIAASYAVKVS